MDVEWIVVNAKRMVNTGYVFETTVNCVATVTSGEIVMKGTTSISVDFPGVPGPDFIPYNDLTQAEILDWVFNTIGETTKSTKEEGAITLANANLNAFLTPTTKNGVPWIV